MKLPLLHYAAVTALFLLLGFAQSGCKKKSSDTDVTIPAVQTANIISGVTATTAQSGGVVTDYGLVTVTSSGVCWSATNSMPTTADSKTTDAISLGIFNSSITGLTAGTTYYVRAYAANTSGTNYGSVLKFTTTSSASPVATVSTFAGSGTAGFLDGAGANAQFNNPEGIAADAAGNVYIADAVNNRIRKISAAGVVSTLAGSGAAGFADGSGTAAQFYSPQGLALDAAGNVYVADLGNNAIRKITPAGAVTTLAGSGVAGWNDATGNTAQFKNPRGLTVDASGNVYVADKGNNRIRKITPAGAVTTVAGLTTAGYTDGAVATATFNQPQGVAMDSKGNLYIADTGNNAIRYIGTDGTVTTFAGGAYDYSLMGYTTAIITDAAGNLYMADEAGRILEITAAKVLYVVAGSAAAGYTNGAGTSALFNVPQTLAADALGNIYVADGGNNVIRKIVTK